MSQHHTRGAASSSSSGGSSSLNPSPQSRSPRTAPSIRSLRSPTSPAPALSRPHSATTNVPLTTPDSRYPPIRNLTTSRSSPTISSPAPPLHIPSTPPRQTRSSNLQRYSPPSTLTRAVNTALPQSPYYSSPPSAFPNHFDSYPSPLPGDVELTPITPKRTPPSIDIHDDSPFHDRHSIIQDRDQAFPLPRSNRAPDNDLDLDYDPIERMSGPLSDEDPFEYSDVAIAGGKQKTMPGYKFSSLSPRGWDEKGDPLTFGPMLEDVRPVSQARRSLYPAVSPIPASTFDDHPDLLSQPPKSLSSPVTSRRPPLIDPVRPRFRALYTLSTWRDYLRLLLPGCVLAILAALIAPYMSMVIGDAFAIFAAYPFATHVASDEARRELKRGVADTSLKLTVAGLLAVLFNYTKGLLWIWYGETVAERLRTKVYTGVQGKGMEWFDTGMGLNAEVGSEEEKREAIGAGGLMSKFNRETDDVRMACALSSGAVVQNMATFVLCFILAMVKSPVLAIVTLSTIPLVVLTQIVTQVLCGPLYAAERQAFAEASTNVERVTSAIGTVKVHNAQKTEQERFLDLITRGKKSLIAQGLVWGISTGMTDFLLLGTFVLGFWYGAKIVRDGKATSGDVMTCFWACLFSATYLQQVVPHLTVITKGKNSMASLLTVIKEDPMRPTSGNPFSPATSPTTAVFPQNDHKSKKRQSKRLSLKGIRPPRCHGEFNFQNLSFAYPSRPDNLVLKDVSLFIPPGETTFIVGGSGSGKSTIAQLLLRLYQPTSGIITMDDQSFGYLDPSFTREHIAAVQQGCILFDMTIHQNVAMGLAGSGPSLDPTRGEVRLRAPKDVTREEVVEACKMAMIHDFIESLPEGYETRLGTGGSSLSGGQRQRLAIARAKIRNPTVLILDEATSALDPTSRILVFQALKAWRNNQTTIVITHDLSQIVSDDFVYVMHNGHISEQGFRVDLMKKTDGVFASMAAEQAVTPFPTKHLSQDSDGDSWEKGLEEILDMEKDFEEVLDDRKGLVRGGTPSFAFGGRPQSGMYLDILDEYGRANRLSGTPNNRSSKRLSNAQKRLTWTPEDLGSRTPSRVGSRPGSRMSRFSNGLDRSPKLSMRGSIETPRLRPSIETTRISPGQSNVNGFLHPGWIEKDGTNPHSTPGRVSMSAIQRQQRTLSENLEDDLKGNSDLALTISSPHTSTVAAGDRPVPIPHLASLIRLYLPTLPAKSLLVIGCIASVGHGVTTPVWSFFLAKLMTIVGAGGTDTSSLTKFGLIVLALCAAQGTCDAVSEWALVGGSARWTHKIRDQAFGKVIKQDKAFFDEPNNSPSRLVQILIKDADDARTLMAQVIGKSVTVTTMIGLGIIWAMVVGWQLTLIGVALAPIFGGYIALDAWMVGKQEVKCKAGREAVGRTFYESISNIRGIRAMALDGVFLEKFEQDAKEAKRLGKRAGWVIAVGGAVVAGLPLFAQALMNFAGSEFMLQNIMNYQQMLQVYNLVLFSLTFGSAMLDFIPTMAKARVAARDFNRLYLLSTETSESKGDLRFPISGHITFSDLSFSYPTRPDVPIFDGLSFTLTPGECVAIVGPSGSGKSTIASLLQRLYVPTSGQIRLDGKYDLQSADVKFLRDHIAVVSQSANLFDTTIAQNIAYGTPNLPLSEIQRAAKAANIHEFIISLPEGYETRLGENASLISGGQAQRLQIARALCRTSNILILDECTSALDVDNARVVLDTIAKIKDSRTTIFITHSVEAMRRCDRIICLGEGRVAEDGTFDELVAKGGVFAQLMKTGEWE
ncbi:ATP-binding cassette, subfamily B (MDR/TAP), member 1 [Kwoniella heveanensis BCC8398]|uniref:ATP-binding cassette, subfamily B (MDR/TAP), member 1 n=1 Tax=Kwoniella heveanensis BCC8398 TaxID=1296120 RepID=A0A1B9GW84_9TREE|nr:ATP-binding cassette, subfamily B (MDR/TAP), member 1 [Kwoniella heveanensis BCC8398]